MNAIAIRFRTSIRILVLGISLALMALTPAKTASAQDTIIVPGVIRDFQSSHSDFDVVPIGGYGHYAGNINTTIGPDYRPVFNGGGFRVNTQWRTKNSDPIAPHMYAMSTGGFVPVASGPIINNNPTVDTFDSTQGAYGGANVGPAPTFVPGSTMPTVSAPAGVMPYVEDVVYKGNGTTTLTTDLHCKTFVAQNNRTLIIDGNLTILCDESFKIENHSSLVIPDGSSLTLYVRKDAVFENNIDINVASSDPTRFMIYNLGVNSLIIENRAHVYANIISPNAPIHVKNNGDFYGTFEGQTVMLENSAGFHIDAQTILDACNQTYNDTLGTAGINSTAGISSASTFNQWYADVLGTNLSQVHNITMTRNGSGVYEYITNAFHPIDDRLFGNEGESHNFNFTYTINASFVYQACSNQFFEFSGADDAWLYINDQLVLDLGGVMPATNQVIEMDRLNLVDGQTYQMQLFYAQRQGVSSDFSFRTNVSIAPATVIAAGTAAFD